MCDNTGAASFSEEERNALLGIFGMFDSTNSGFIEKSELADIMEKIGRDPNEAAAILDSVDKIAGGGGDGKISFDEFLELLSMSQNRLDIGDDGPDPKVLEFLNILDEYRLKCEDEGNYLEAGRANGQLETLRKQEERRQQKSLKARQLAERQDVQIAHNMQYADFNGAWDKYMDEYDQMAQMYIQQMTEKHAVALLEFQEQLHKEVIDKPPKFSKELLEWRRRQHMLARQKNYAEAQKIKRIADVMEERERKSLDEMNRQQFARRETKFRAQQQSELQALLKRIDGRRKEHIKQRNLDSKRLLQRNRNVQAVLESKQSVEAVKSVAEIKANLAPKVQKHKPTPMDSIPDAARGKVKKEKTKKAMGGDEFGDTFLTDQPF
jgi:hypothetical protein